MIDNLVIGNYSINWYQIILFVTFIIVTIFSVWINKFDDNIFVQKHSFIIILLYTMFFTLIGATGARLLAFFDVYFTATNIYFSDIISFEKLIKNTYGYSWHGGFLLVTLIIVIFSYLKFNNELRIKFINYNTLLFSLAYSLGRQACFLSADGCYGIPTNHPFGMRFLHGIKPTLLTVHPTPLYESISNFFIFLLIFKIRKMTNFIPCSLFLILSGISRFLIEYLRNSVRIVFNLTSAQLISLSMIIIGLFIFVNQLNYKFSYYEK